MQEYPSSLTLLDREEAELLPVRETLLGDITVNTVIGINLAFAFSGLGRAAADAMQSIGVR